MMQEGAGVRQIVEDELRALGLRLRDLDVRLELGLQESVRSAVQAGYGVTFISRSAVEPELAAGTLAAARVEGLDATSGDLARARGRPDGDPRRRRVRRVRARPHRVIVRWGLGELAGLLDELGVEQPVPARERAASRSRGMPGSVGWWSELPTDRIGEVAAAATAAERTRSSRSAAAARSTRRRPSRPRRRCPSSRSRRRTPAPSGRRSSASATRAAGCGAAAPARALDGDRLRAGAHARAAARGDGRHGAERARALRRGAVRPRARRPRATRTRSKAPR